MARTTIEKEAAVKIPSVKGTRDFYPEQMRLQQWLIDAWRRVSLRNGFEEVGGPVFEYLDLYTVKSGDGIVSELFSFEDRGGRRLALRPEFTPTLARMIAAKANSLRRPIKWFSVPNFFRAERPQRGRLREFYQWNIDVVGADSSLADAEVIFALVDLLAEIGVNSNEAKILLSSRPLLAELLKDAAVDPAKNETVFAVMDKMGKMTPDELEKFAFDQGLSVKDVAAMREVIKLSEIKELRKYGGPAAQQLVEVWAQLSNMGADPWLQLDLGIVRGLAYYTGPVFEVFDTDRQLRSTAGGGRYDNLISLFGGPPMPATGFGSGDAPTFVLLETLGKLPQLQHQTDVFLIRGDNNSKQKILRLAGALRQAGLRTTFSYKPSENIGKQLKEADTAAACWAVIVGAADHDDDEVIIKDMKAGHQQVINVNTLLTDPKRTLGMKMNEELE